MSHFSFEFINKRFCLVGDTIFYLDKPIVIRAVLPLKFEEILLWSRYQALLHRLVIWIVLLSPSLSGLTTRVKICSNWSLKRTLVTFTRNHAPSRSFPPLIIYRRYANYLVTTYSCHFLHGGLILLIGFLHKLVILGGRLLVERVVNGKVHIVMVDFMVAALNWQLFTTTHFRCWRLLQDLQNSVVISWMMFGLVSLAQTHKLLVLWIISVITVMKQLLWLQVDFVQIVVHRRRFQLL